MDTRACKTPRISEENDRQREQGWFLLRALQTAQMSFDLSHIPSSMVSKRGFSKVTPTPDDGHYDVDPVVTLACSWSVCAQVTYVHT